MRSSGFLAAFLLVSVAAPADSPSDPIDQAIPLLDPVPPGAMHADHVEKFIAAEGFGIRRKLSVLDLPHTDVLWVEDVYRVTTAELIGLLVAERARVYVEPRTGVEPVGGRHAVRSVKDRSLDAFETRSLRRLQAGESLVFELEPDGLRGLGAIVARPECRLCHAVDEGELLGAFTYRLRRADDGRRVRLQAPATPDP